MKDLALRALRRCGARRNLMAPGLFFALITLLIICFPLTRRDYSSADPGNSRGPVKDILTSSLERDNGGIIHIFNWTPDQVPGYQARWFRVHSGQFEVGDEVDVYDQSKKVYSFYRASKFVESIQPWVEPVEDPRSSGLLVTLLGFAGSSREYVIIGSDHGSFRIVLDVLSLRAGERPLEMVDLDGDSNPEIVSIDDYTGLFDSYGGAVYARAWKWSRAKFRYENVRTSIYSQRLRPLAKPAPK